MVKNKQTNKPVEIISTPNDHKDTACHDFLTYTQKDAQSHVNVLKIVIHKWMS